MLLLTSIALAQECATFDLDARADQAIALLLDSQFDRALEVTDETIAQLECLEHVADPMDLATIWQIRGAVGVYGDKPALVNSELQQAAAMNPGYFNAALGPKVRAEWVAAGEDPGEPGRLTIQPIPDDGVLHIDGQPWTDQPALLTPGIHLIQVSVDQDVAFAKVVSLGPAMEITVETGLDPATKRVRITPWLVAGTTPALAAGGTYTTAVFATQKMVEASEDDDPEGVLSGWNTVRGLGYVATPVLVVSTGAFAVAHVRELKRRRAARPPETSED